MKFGKVESIIWSYTKIIWPKKCSFSNDRIPKYCIGGNVLRLSNVSRLMLILAWRDLKDNREDEAIRRLQFVFKMSSLLWSSANLVAYHLGLSIHAMCLSEINSMIDSSQIPPNILPEILILIEKNRVGVRDLKDSLSGEYDFQKGLWNSEKEARNSVCAILMEGDMFGALIGLPCKIVPSKLFIHKNTTERKLYHVYSFILNETESSTLDIKAYSNTVPESVYHYNPQVTLCHGFLLDDLPFLQAMGLLLKGNAVGEDVVWSTWFYFRIIKWKYLIVEAKNNALLYKTAIKNYENESGKLPENGSALIPKYLDRIPDDPFIRKPLRYSLKQRLIYSVGWDMKDNGGRSKNDFIYLDKQDLQQEKDWVLHIK